jgi:hypothetical protein
MKNVKTVMFLVYRTFSFLFFSWVETDKEIDDTVNFNESVACGGGACELV